MSQDIIPASRTWFTSNVHRQFIPGRLVVGWQDRFRKHRRDVISGRNDLPVPANFNQANHTLEDLKVAVLKAGLANQEYRKKQKMRLLFKYETVSPSGLNQDFSFA